MAKQATKKAAPKKAAPKKKAEAAGAPGGSLNDPVGPGR
jgi:hypothetical protein